MPTQCPWIILSFLTLVVASPAFAQDAAPELPGFLMTFAAGHWWVVPAYGLFALMIAAVDATFFTEAFKSTWPKPARMIWNWVSVNVGKSKNQGSAD